jgi:hypothetical protein
MSDRNVQYYLRGLERKGYVKTEYTGGRGQRNQYHLNLEKLHFKGAEAFAPLIDRNRVQDSVEDRVQEPLHPIENLRVQDSVSKGANQRQLGCKISYPNKEVEPSGTVRNRHSSSADAEIERSNHEKIKDYISTKFFERYQRKVENCLIACLRTTRRGSGTTGRA